MQKRARRKTKICSAKAAVSALRISKHTRHQIRAILNDHSSPSTRARGRKEDQKQEKGQEEEEQDEIDEEDEEEEACLVRCVRVRACERVRVCSQVSAGVQHTRWRRAHPHPRRRPTKINRNTPK